MLRSSQWFQATVSFWHFPNVILVFLKWPLKISGHLLSKPVIFVHLVSYTKCWGVWDKLSLTFPLRHIWRFTEGHVRGPDRSNHTTRLRSVIWPLKWQKPGYTFDNKKVWLGQEVMAERALDPAELKGHRVMSPNHDCDRSAADRFTAHWPDFVATFAPLPDLHDCNK